MRRSTTLAVLLGTAVALVTGVTGLALAQVTGSDPRTPGTVFGIAAAARSTSFATPATAEPETARSMVSASAQTVILVTVPELSTDPNEESSAEQATQAPPPIPETTETTAPDPTPEAVPTPEPAPAPAPAPADVPLAPPYTAVLGWTGVGQVAYLTFDDGPGPYTGQILDILAAAGVKATFCEVGQKVTENPGLTQRVVADGHTLCNHSWDHYSPFDTLPAQTLDQEIGLTQNAFLQATGVTVRYFRAPEGRFGDPGGAVLQAGQRARTIPLAWGVDSLDWKKPGAPAIVSTVLASVSPGAVILLHDGGGADREETIAALPGIISGLQ